MDLESQFPCCRPLEDVGGTAGYTNISAVSDSSQLAQTANKYLNDFFLLNKLTNRVYELLREDIRYQRERVDNYGCNRW
ncbi:MAG: hypothetical protein WBF90_30975 [Rivularia sp. (in: cyanobacteria)]|jgi:hypothetical protein